MNVQLSPELEAALLHALNTEGFDAALDVMREVYPGWGEGKSGNAFSLRFDPNLFHLILAANPPQIERFTEQQRKGIRITSVMQHFAGTERNSEKWLPSDITWERREDRLLPSKMCFFWARSAQDNLFALSAGYTKKTVLGHGNVTDPIHGRCDYCAAIHDLGPIPIKADFEPGIVFPPFRGCAHPKYACRCMVEYLK